MVAGIFRAIFTYLFAGMSGYSTFKTALGGHAHTGTHRTSRRPRTSQPGNLPDERLLNFQNGARQGDTHTRAHSAHGAHSAHPAHLMDERFIKASTHVLHATPNTRGI